MICGVLALIFIANSIYTYWVQHSVLLFFSYFAVIVLCKSMQKQVLDCCEFLPSNCLHTVACIEFEILLWSCFNIGKVLQFFSEYFYLLESYCNVISYLMSPSKTPNEWKYNLAHCCLVKHMARNKPQHVRNRSESTGWCIMFVASSGYLWGEIQTWQVLIYAYVVPTPN